MAHHRRAPDDAVSGATPFVLRAGSKALLADALAGRFDILIVEGLDRTSSSAWNRLIDEEQAEVVRCIFQCFVEGWAPMTIAHELNRRGIPSPRGGTLASSALHGSAARGLGLLHNELYASRVIWNRRQWLKDSERRTSAGMWNARRASGRCASSPNWPSSTPTPGRFCVSAPPTRSATAPRTPNSGSPRFQCNK